MEDEQGKNNNGLKTKTPDGVIHGKNDCLYLLFDYMW